MLTDKELLEHYKQLYADVKKEKDELKSNTNIIALEHAIKLLNEYKKTITTRGKLIQIKETMEVLSGLYYELKRG